MLATDNQMVIPAQTRRAVMLQRPGACRETAVLHAQAQQWIDEVNGKALQLRTALYHGPNRCRDFPLTRLACTDVVVTTYNVLHSEFNAAPQGSLYRVPWHRCFFCHEASALHSVTPQLGFLECASPRSLDMSEVCGPEGHSWTVVVSVSLLELHDALQVHLG